MTHLFTRISGFWTYTPHFSFWDIHALAHRPDNSAAGTWYTHTHPTPTPHLTYPSVDRCRCYRATAFTFVATPLPRHHTPTSSPALPPARLLAYRHATDCDHVPACYAAVHARTARTCAARTCRPHLLLLQRNFAPAPTVRAATARIQHIARLYCYHGYRAACHHNALPATRYTYHYHTVYLPPAATYTTRFTYCLRACLWLCMACAALYFLPTIHSCSLSHPRGDVELRACLLYSINCHTQVCSATQPLHPMSPLSLCHTSPSFHSVPFPLPSHSYSGSGLPLLFILPFQTYACPLPCRALPCLLLHTPLPPATHSGRAGVLPVPLCHSFPAIPSGQVGTPPLAHTCTSTPPCTRTCPSTCPPAPAPTRPPSPAHPY